MTAKSDLKTNAIAILLLFFAPNPLGNKERFEVKNSRKIHLLKKFSNIFIEREI